MKLSKPTNSYIIVKRFRLENTHFILFLMPLTIFAEDNVSNVLFDQTSKNLEKAIYEMNKRQNAVAYNIANASTPGFKPIRFQDEVEKPFACMGMLEC